jgi:hypothetical protein
VKLRAAFDSSCTRFKEELEGALGRKVAVVSITPLHGAPAEFSSVSAAIDMVMNYEEEQLNARDLPLAKFEVVIRYTNGDRISAEFAQASDAVDFLRTFE